MTAGVAREFVIPTKLLVPRLLDSWVLRERLIAQLAGEAACKLTLVVAPAGFGKSTLVAQWLSIAQHARRGRHVAWLTLDEHDQDGIRFLSYLASAIVRVLPDSLETTRALLATAQPPLHAVLQALLVDLAALGSELTLVLDDYHLISAEPVHQTVTYLVRHLPPQCHLVLISRIDPPLPLARLRAERQLAELRTTEMRFTEAEVDALLAHQLGVAPDPQVVTALCEQTEGWAIALQLAVLAGLDGRSPAYVRHAATRQIAEYLADEVLDCQPEPIQRILLTMAVPDRFCAELCAVMLDRPHDLVYAERMLESLVRSNLFVVPLDDDARWYRFHHLFRDLLLRRLRLNAEDDVVRALQRRAAGWFAAEGLLEDAVQLLLAAGDADAAADLVERRLLLEVGKDVPSEPPGVWLRMLPTTLIARRPGLALIAARLSVFSMDMDEFPARLAHVDALLADPATSGSAPPWPSFQADLMALRGILCYWQGRPSETIAYMRAAIEQGPTTALAIQALLQIGMAYVGSGNYDEGVRLIGAGLLDAETRLGERHILYQYSCLSSMHQLAGELGAQARDARRLADAVARLGAGDLWVGYAAVGSGLPAYEQDDLAAATTAFGRLVSRKYRVSYPGYMSGVIGLALIAAAQGAFAEAESLVQEATEFAAEAGGAFLRHQALGCAVRVALARGDRERAVRAASGINADIHLGLSLALEAPRLSQARALIATGDPASLARADAILAGCLHELQPLHHTRLLIATLAALALLRQAQGRRAAATLALEQAVTLAAPRGFVRTFVDLGPPLLPLLQGLSGRDVAPAYLTRLLAAFTPADPGLAAHPPLAVPQVPEMLTHREVEILSLLAERWSNQEIADRLVISPNTVRKHTSTIYDKLGVGSRREAVAAARALGLLPQE